MEDMLLFHNVNQVRLALDDVRNLSLEPPLKLRVHSPPPVTLHLNSEAREETLHYYIVVFETYRQVAYFNPACDVLVLPSAPRPLPSILGAAPRGAENFLSALAAA